MQGKYFLVTINQVNKLGLVFFFWRNVSQVKLEGKILYFLFEIEISCLGVGTGSTCGEVLDWLPLSMAPDLADYDHFH